MVLTFVFEAAFGQNKARVPLLVVCFRASFLNACVANTPRMVPSMSKAQPMTASTNEI